MCDPLTAGLALGSAALSAYQGEKQRKASNTAADNAARAADQAANKANPKKPAGAFAAENLMANSGGAGSTLLTGPSGIDPSKLLLGKSTLLGG